MEGDFFQEKRASCQPQLLQCCYWEKHFFLLGNYFLQKCTLRDAAGPPSIAGTQHRCHQEDEERRAFTPARTRWCGPARSLGPAGKKSSGSGGTAEGYGERGWLPAGAGARLCPAGAGGHRGSRSCRRQTARSARLLRRRGFWQQADGEMTLLACREGDEVKSTIWLAHLSAPLWQDKSLFGKTWGQGLSELLPARGRQHRAERD